MHTFIEHTNFTIIPFMYITDMGSNRGPFFSKKLCMSITCLRSPP